MRARITKVNSRSITCKIEVSELTEQESSLHLRGGESSFPEWIQNPMTASFALEDQKLLDLARSFQDRNVVLSVNDGTVVAIDAVRDGPVCHFCNNRRFTSEFVHEALCNRIACKKLIKKLIKELFEVTRPRERGEVWGDDVPIESRYVYQGDNGKLEYFKWESPGKRRFLRREFYHVYRAHKAKICTTCEGKQEALKLTDLQKRLQDEFEHNKRTFNVTGAVIAE